MRLKINQLNVDRLEQTSGIYSGHNLHLGHNSILRVSEGFGTISGIGNQAINGIHGAAGNRMKEAEAYGGEKR
ncbi:MAG: hypothetical protein K6T85_17980 [Gorillibacterium sp.]|nr:hypothetical protein [Gorillibacterium sp.]